MSKIVKRLFTQFIPKNYTLFLDLDKKLDLFKGKVIITGNKVGRPSQRLTFHQNALKITKAKIIQRSKKGDVNIVVDRINIHNKFDEVRLHSSQLLYSGEYSITLEFSGEITRPMNGLYPCFFELKGKKEQLLATQFESHHAREVFPCIDEPEAKAVFDLTLSTEPGETVLSDTQINNQTTKHNKVITTFESTPIMSTYLLAFVTGKLDFLETKTTNKNTTVRTYATPENAQFTEFALNTAAKCLDFYTEYFDIDYPLSKCDLIALPDFASGAMENWGCITFREQALLVDPNNSSLSNKQYVALVVAHELAHMWFGNLVTMRWWTDLWLNEGFASWIAFLAIDNIYPEWKIWTQFVIEEQQPALKLDALENTHPIEVTINHPDEIRTIFDAISYCKGASIIGMLHYYLGANDFKNGLRKYLTTHKYSNATTADLWKSLEEISKKPVGKFMSVWTRQPGFPIVNVNVDHNKVDISQNRFYMKPKNNKIEDPIWVVPLLINEKSAPIQLTDTKTCFDVRSPSDFRLNCGQSGYYRTTYDSAHLAKLSDLVKNNRLEPADRIGILSDLFETAKTGQSSTVDALKFINNFHSEDNYAVWDIIAGSLGGIKIVMNDKNIREIMKPYTRNLVQKQLARLGWDTRQNESHFDKLLRPIILGLAAASDEPNVINKAKKLFDNLHKPSNGNTYLKQPYTAKRVKRGDIDPELRGVVFGAAARHGDVKEFNKMLKMHNISTMSEEKNALVAGLTNFKQPKLIDKALSLITTDDVRLQDVPYWITYSSLNLYAKSKTWDWIKQNWQWLHNNLGNDLSFSRMPIYVARVNSDESFIKEYREFFEPRLSPTLDRSYKQGLEMLEWQSAWKQRDLKEIVEFFTNQSQ